MRLSRVLALVAVVLAGLLAVFVINPTLFFDVGAKELAYSLGAEVEGGGGAECRSRGDGRWLCRVSIGGSSVQRYVLTNDEECWEAKPLSDEPANGRTQRALQRESLSGCVDFFDFTRIDDRLYGTDR